MANPSLTDMLKQAMALHQSEQLDAARAGYLEVLTLQPDHPEALHLMGMLMAQQGETEPGCALIRRAIALRDGHYPGAARNLATFTEGGVTTKWHTEDQRAAAPEALIPTGFEDTIDGWRHRSMVDFTRCFADQDASWLTIGDLNGGDAMRLRSHGIRGTVVASNLTTASLKPSHDAGLIGDYMAINAEAISLPDGSFDYVLCKESMHHMPRPMLAIYEMLRVAREAVFLVEPQDPVIDLPRQRESSYWYEAEGNRLAIGAKGSNVPVMNLSIDWFECPGQYVYTLSRREIRKLSYGMGLPVYGYKNFSDNIDADLLVQPATNPVAMAAWRAKVGQMDQLAALQALPYSYISAVFFKRFPRPEIIERLAGYGFSLFRTPASILALDWPNFDEAQ